MLGNGKNGQANIIFVPFYEAKAMKYPYFYCLPKVIGFNLKKMFKRLEALLDLLLHIYCKCYVFLEAYKFCAI